MSFADELWELSKELDNPSSASSQPKQDTVVKDAEPLTSVSELQEIAGFYAKTNPEATKKPFLFSYVRSGSYHKSFMGVINPDGVYKIIPDPECVCPCLNDVVFSFLEFALHYAGNIATYHSVVDVLKTYLTVMKLDVTQIIYDQDGNITSDSKHVMEFIVTSILNPILCGEQSPKVPKKMSHVLPEIPDGAEVTIVDLKKEPSAEEIRMANNIGIQGSGKKVMPEGLSAGQPRKNIVFSPSEDLCSPEDLDKLNGKCKAINVVVQGRGNISPLDKLRRTLEAMGCTLIDDEAVPPTSS